MLLRKLGKRGTAVVEYAVILAFVAAIGTSFTSDNGMSGSIKGIVGKVEQMLGLAAGNEAEGKHPLKYDDSVTGNTSKFLEVQTGTPYDYLSGLLKENFGEDAELKAIGFNMWGDLNAIYYAKGEELLAVDNAGQYAGSWKDKTGLAGQIRADLEGKGIDENTALKYQGHTDKAPNLTNAEKNNFMYVAYDKYGNVTDKVNTTGLKVSDKASAVETKETQLAYKNKTDKTFEVYKYNNNSGFYRESSTEIQL